MKIKFIVKDVTSNFHAASDRPVDYVKDEFDILKTFPSYEEAAKAIGDLNKGVYSIEKVFIITN